MVNKIRICGTLSLVICLVFFGIGISQENSQTPEITFLLADFTDCLRQNPPVANYGAFYTPGKGFTIETCLEDPLDPEAHGEVLRIKYDVSPSGSFVGFWMKWSSNSFDINQYEALRLDIRGDVDQGFTTKLKVELKIKGWGWRANEFKDITQEWQTAVIDLTDFDIHIGEWEEDVNEFVLTFINGEVTESKGRIFIDNINFTAASQNGD